MTEYSNVATPVILNEAALEKILTDLFSINPTVKPDRIFITPEGLALQRERGVRLGIPGAATMGPQELFDAMVRLL